MGSTEENGTVVEVPMQWTLVADEVAPFTEDDFNKVLAHARASGWKPMVSWDIAKGEESVITRWLVDNETKTMKLLGVSPSDLGTTADYRKGE